MKIGHRYLETAGQDVATWVRAALQPKRGMKGSYASKTREAIFRLHREGDLPRARDYLRRQLESFRDLARKDDADYQLVAYARWLESAQPIVADVRITIDYSLAPDLSLGGQVSRLDTDGTRYTAVLLGSLPDDWPRGSRFPLLQRAIAAAYQRNERAVSVAVQELDGTGLQARHHSKSACDAAEAAAQRLAVRIQQELQRQQAGPP